MDINKTKKKTTNTERERERQRWNIIVETHPLQSYHKQNRFIVPFVCASIDDQSFGPLKMI